MNVTSMAKLLGGDVYGPRGCASQCVHWDAAVASHWLHSQVRVRVQIFRLCGCFGPVELDDVGGNSEQAKR